MGQKSDYFGVNFNTGLSLTSLDVHVGYSWSSVDFQFNVGELGMSVKEFIDEMKQAAKRGPESFRDWMKKRNISKEKYSECEEGNGGSGGGSGIGFFELVNIK